MLSLWSKGRKYLKTETKQKASSQRDKYLGGEKGGWRGWGISGIGTHWGQEVGDTAVLYGAFGGRPHWIRHHLSRDLGCISEWDEKTLEGLYREVMWSHQHFSSVTLMAMLRTDCKGRSRDHLGEYCKSPDKRWQWRWWQMVKFWLYVEGRAKGMCWWGGEEMR